MFFFSHNQRIQNRYKKQRYKRRTCKPTNNSNSNRLNHCRTSARSKTHRQHTKNCRKSCHQHRAQTTCSCFKAGIVHFAATVNQKICVVNQNNSIVYNNSYKHYKSNSTGHAKSLPGNLVNKNNAYYQEWNCHQIDKRSLERLISSCHYTKNQQNRHQSNKSVSSALLLRIFPCTFIGNGYTVRDNKGRCNSISYILLNFICIAQTVVVGCKLYNPSLIFTAD